MIKTLTRFMLGRMSKRYDYDTTYMDHMLTVAPRAFFKFSRLTAPAAHRRVVEPTPYFATKLVAALAEDCGPCTQLVTNMAREARMPDREIVAVLEGRTDDMSPATATAYEFAKSVVERRPDLEDRRAAVRARWGDEGVVEMSMCIALSRVFPMLKAGLGYASSCTRVLVDDRRIAMHAAHMPHAAYEETAAHVA